MQHRNVFLKGSLLYLEIAGRYLRPAGYLATGVSTYSDVKLSMNGQQSWVETGFNGGVTAVSLSIGGWPGLVLQLDYMAAKAYLNTIINHPEFSPINTWGRR